MTDARLDHITKIISEINVLFDRTFSFSQFLILTAGSFIDIKYMMIDNFCLVPFICSNSNRPKTKIIAYDISLFLYLLVIILYLNNRLHTDKEEWNSLNQFNLNLLVFALIILFIGLTLVASKKLRDLFFERSIMIRFPIFFAFKIFFYCHAYLYL